MRPCKRCHYSDSLEVGEDNMKKRNILISLVAVLLAATLVYSASTVTKGLIGKQDMALWYSGDSAATFTRSTSEGYTLTLNKLDWVGIDAFQVWGGGVNKNRAVLVSAQSDIDTTSTRSIWLGPGTWTIDDDLTFASYPNLFVHMAPGAIFSVSTGKTLTIYSPANIIAQPNQQIFSGSGVVAFSTGGIIYPEWWGAKGDGSTDDSVALQAAFTSAVTSGYRSEIIFQPRNYTYATALTIPYAQGMTLKGKGGYFTPSGSGYNTRVTTLSYTGAGVALTIGDGAQSQTGFRMEGIYLKGTSSATGGIYLDTAGGVVLRDMTIGLFSQASAYGLKLTNCQVNSFYNIGFVGNYYGTVLGDGAAENTTNKFYDCVWNGNTNHAFYMTHGNGGQTLYSPTFQTNGGSAIFIDATVGDKDVYNFVVYGGYFSVNNTTVAGMPIDIRGRAGVGFKAQGITIRDTLFGSPGAAQTAFLRFRNTLGTVLDNIRFGSATTTIIVASTADNNFLRIYNWVLASSYIKDAVGGNTVYWQKDMPEDTYQRILRGGNVVIHQEAPALGAEALKIWQQDNDKAFIDFQGASEASASLNLSTWTTGGAILGFIKIEINGSELWLPFYTAPTGP